MVKQYIIVHPCISPLFTVHVLHPSYHVKQFDGISLFSLSLSKHLDSKYGEIRKNLGNLGESKLMLITAIKVVDDYFDLMKKVKSTKNDFEKLSLKFKEIKELAINYKNEKESEIEKLKDELDKFKTTIDTNRNSYEAILEKTTKTIEKFIESADINQQKNIQ